MKNVKQSTFRESEISDAVEHQTDYINEGKYMYQMLFIIAMILDLFGCYFLFFVEGSGALLPAVMLLVIGTMITFITAGFQDRKKQQKMKDFAREFKREAELVEAYKKTLPSKKW